MSKGSVPRPQDKKKFDSEFERIFGCKHDNHVPAGYPVHLRNYRVQSIYHIYCEDCRKFINTLDNSTIDNEEYVPCY